MTFNVKALPDFSKARILIVGDVMLDRYWHGDTKRISPEAPVPVVNIILHPNANVPTYLENLFTSLSSIVHIYAAKTTANPE